MAEMEKEERFDQILGTMQQFKAQEYSISGTRSTCNLVLRELAVPDSVLFNQSRRF